MYYVYVLKSEKDGQFYTGYTDNLERRFLEHKTDKVQSTNKRLPVKIVYYEACLNQQYATHREKYLKSSWGKRYIKTRLESYLTG